MVMNLSNSSEITQIWSSVMQIRYCIRSQSLVIFVTPPILFLRLVFWPVRWTRLHLQDISLTSILSAMFDKSPLPKCHMSWWSETIIYLEYMSLWPTTLKTLENISTNNLKQIKNGKVPNWEVKRTKDPPHI